MDSNHSQHCQLTEDCCNFQWCPFSCTFRLQTFWMNLGQRKTHNWRKVSVGLGEVWVFLQNKVVWCRLLGNTRYKSIINLLQSNTFQVRGNHFKQFCPHMIPVTSVNQDYLQSVIQFELDRTEICSRRRGPMFSGDWKMFLDSARWCFVNLATIQKLFFFSKKYMKVYLILRTQCLKATCVRCLQEKGICKKVWKEGGKDWNLILDMAGSREI